MRKLLRIAVALLVGVAAVAILVRVEPGLADEDNIENQVVVVQSQITVDVPYRFGNVAVSSDMIRIVPMREAGQLLVAGRRSGTTNVILYDVQGVLRDEFEVTVIPANLSRVMKNVQELLNDVEGLSFKIINDRVYILGEVSIDEELARVIDLADREALVESQVTLSPIAQRLIAGLIETEIDTPGVAARLINDKVLLEGVVHSPGAAIRAEAIARAYYDQVINVLEVREVDRVPGRTDTIVIIVHFVELAKSLTTTWGFEWTPVATSGGVEFFFSQDYLGGWADLTGVATGSVSALLPRLDRARSAGYARVLENPTVAVKSGEPASIFSGFEYPYLVSQGLTNTVDFKNIGITLNVTPYAQGNDVDMNLSVEVTALGDIAPNGLQAIDRSAISTAEYCRAGESIVIGGLQRVSDAVIYNRVPANDVLGALYTFYANRDYKKTKSQFLVFLTPQIHESSSSANREIKDQFNLQEVRQ